MQQLPVEPIVGNIVIPTGDIANNGAIANSQAFQRAAAQDASGSLIALQLQNTNVAIPVAADVDANVCGVSVLAEPAPVTCQTTPGQGSGQ